MLTIVEIGVIPIYAIAFWSNKTALSAQIIASYL